MLQTILRKGAASDEPGDLQALIPMFHRKVFSSLPKFLLLYYFPTDTHAHTHRCECDIISKGGSAKNKKLLTGC